MTKTNTTKELIQRIDLLNEGTIPMLKNFASQLQKQLDALKDYVENSSQFFYDDEIETIAKEVFSLQSIHMAIDDINSLSVEIHEFLGE